MQQLVNDEGDSLSKRRSAMVRYYILRVYSPPENNSRHDGEQRFNRDE